MISYVMSEKLEDIEIISSTQTLWQFVVVYGCHV